MRTAIVKGPDSNLYGAPCQGCPRRVTTGQAVLWKLQSTGERFVLHVDCAQAAINKAPAGLIDAGHSRAAWEAIRARARRITA